MGWLRRVLGGGRGGDEGPGAREPAGEPEEPNGDERGVDVSADRHLVVVWLRLADAAFEDEREQQRVFALEDRIMRTLYASGAGDFDTNELMPGYFAMRLVGADADRVMAVVLPLLEGVPPGSYLAVRRGPAGASEERVDLPVA